MITEFRKIVFSKDEIMKAILNHNARSTSKLPAGDIVSVRAENEPEPILTLEIHDPTEGKSTSTSLKSHYLAAVMLRHCISSKVPVPRNATKHVEIMGESVALSLTINANPKQVYDIKLS